MLTVILRGYPLYKHSPMTFLATAKRSMHVLCMYSHTITDCSYVYSTVILSLTKLLSYDIFLVLYVSVVDDPHI